MFLDAECPVCLGSKVLCGSRVVRGLREEYEVSCWACRGTGRVKDQEDRRPDSLKPIIPEGE